MRERAPDQQIRRICDAAGRCSTCRVPSLPCSTQGARDVTLVNQLAYLHRKAPDELGGALADEAQKLIRVSVGMLR